MKDCLFETLYGDFIPADGWSSGGESLMRFKIGREVDAGDEEEEEEVEGDEGEGDDDEEEDEGDEVSGRK